MPGGTFDYNQYKITDIAEEIQARLDRQGKMSKGSYWEPPHPYETFPPEVELRLKEAVAALRIAAIYAQRADWFFSGNDGEESFIRRLDKELIDMTKELRT
jgi:hypothetical protein